MPYYTARCLSCKHEQDYIRKIAEMHDTPLCEQCDSSMEKILNAPMIAAMGITSGSFQTTSPIDGKPIHGRTEYYEHMKKHNVVPQSDLAGQAERVQAEKKKAEKKQRRETIERIVHTAR